jgi:hypothetical protein
MLDRIVGNSACAIILEGPSRSDRRPVSLRKVALAERGYAINEK